MKPEVGQRIYRLNVGSAASRYVPQELTPCHVVKVGRKYFAVRAEGDDRGWTDSQHYIEGWGQVTDYSPTCKLYSNPEQRDREVEANELVRCIKSHFDVTRRLHGISLEKLRAIKAILDQEE